MRKRTALVGTAARGTLSLETAAATGVGASAGAVTRCMERLAPEAGFAAKARLAAEAGLVAARSKATVLLGCVETAFAAAVFEAAAFVAMLESALFATLFASVFEARLVAELTA
ncbi:MAG: hypothetical protein JO370_02330, partial [Paucibacter sp.]|nr:hypothetical protein [Roseateles sp.]